jgi:hypothetical protein
MNRAASPLLLRPRSRAASHFPIDRRRSIENKTADPYQESAVNTTAAAGMPPEPHEREAVSITRPRALGFSADRTGRHTKCIRHAGTHGVCAGPQVERDARLWHAEGSGVSHPGTDRTRMRRVPAARPSMVGHGKPRVKELPRGERAAERSAAPGVCYRAGLRSSRGSTHALDRTPTVCPDSRDFGPPARPCEGLLMMARPHRREATWRTLDDRASTRLLASTRCSIA